MKVVIAGGSGMLGRALGAALLADGVDVVRLSRRPAANGPADATGPGRAVTWDGRTTDGAWTTELADADAVIDLCGHSVGTWPWTSGTKARLRSSRLEPRTALVEAMHGLPADRRPRTLIAISGTDGYVGSDEVPAGEDTPLADTFLGQLCEDWEAAALPARDLGVRVVIPRTSVIVGRGAPVLARLTLPVRLFVGGRIGSGRQWFSWVHLEDWLATIRLLLDRTDIEGVVNVASPGALQQAEVAQALGRVLRRPSVVWTPGFVIRLVLGGQSDLILGSRRVGSGRLRDLGFEFAWSDFEAAVRDAVR